MEDTNALIEQRRSKLASLQAKGVDPFKNKFKTDIGCGEAREKFEKGDFTEGQAVAIAGRISSHRDMGKSQFLDLKDVSGCIQIYAQKQTLGDEGFEIFKHLDLADFIGVKGTLFKTRAGEISVKVESFTILAKALRPPPAKWEGLADTEIRYRQRYLDLIANDDVKNVFLKRSAIVHEIRSFFHGRGYVEVETPAMQPIPGGAAAAPFKTFHNALGCEFYLRIALELYHKRLLVGGINKLFEIGKNFRNEGLSRRHNPEFTMLEAYEAFGDYETMMETVQSLICGVAQKVLGTLKIRRPRKSELFSTILKDLEAIRLATDKIDAIIGDGKGTLLTARLAELNHAFDRALFYINSKPTQDTAKQAKEELTKVRMDLSIPANQEGLLGTPEMSALISQLDAAIEHLGPFLEENERDIIDLTPNWRRAKYKDLVREVAGQDWFDVSTEERRRRAAEDLKLAGDIAAGYEDFEVTGAVFEKLIEPTLINPTFVTHLPKELVPLAKITADDPTTVEVFECCINGQEISPGYTEQNDPVAQRAALEHQAGGEQQKLDEDFLVALEHGMPPAGGIGIGIDRLCMMLLGQESIRDVILFPQMRPK
jgi:lysyl-tRNA synthetase class 2